MNEINILGTVDAWMSENREKLKRTLDNSKGMDITVNIASEGGDVLEGMAIAALLSDYKGTVIAKGFGVVASIATIIMLAADKKYMSKTGFFMIHNSWTFAAGNKEELQKQGDVLGKIDEEMLKVYVSTIQQNGKLIGGDRNKTEKEVRRMMEEETWLSADEALELGLIDGIIEETENANLGLTAFARFRAQASNYKNIPQNLIDMQKEEKKGILASLAAFFGFKADIKEIEEEAQEVAEAVVETPELETPEESTEAVELEAQSTKLAELKAEIEAQTKALEELQAKQLAAQADYKKEETKAEPKANNGFSKDHIKQLAAFVENVFK